MSLHLRLMVLPSMVRLPVPVPTGNVRPRIGVVVEIAVRGLAPATGDKSVAFLHEADKNIAIIAVMFKYIFPISISFYI
jgi:hypothetical protein